MTRTLDREARRRRGFTLDTLVVLSVGLAGSQHPDSRRTTSTYFNDSSTLKIEEPP